MDEWIHSWVSAAEYELLKHNPAVLFDKANKHLHTLHVTLANLQNEHNAMLFDPKFQQAQTIQRFHTMKSEHSVLTSRVHSLERQQQALEQRVDSLREEKQALLVQINEMRAAIVERSRSNVNLELLQNEFALIRQVLDLKIEEQTAQLVALDRDVCGYQQQCTELSAASASLRSTLDEVEAEHRAVIERKASLVREQAAHEGTVERLEQQIATAANAIAIVVDELVATEGALGAELLQKKRHHQSAADEVMVLRSRSAQERQAFTDQHSWLTSALAARVEEADALRGERAEYSAATAADVSALNASVRDAEAAFTEATARNRSLEQQVAALVDDVQNAHRGAVDRDQQRAARLDDLRAAVSELYIALSTSRENVRVLASRGGGRFLQAGIPELPVSSLVDVVSGTARTQARTRAEPQTGRGGARGGSLGAGAGAGGGGDDGVVVTIADPQFDDARAPRAQHGFAGSTRRDPAVTPAASRGAPHPPPTHQQQQHQPSDTYGGSAAGSAGGPDMHVEVTLADGAVLGVRVPQRGSVADVDAAVRAAAECGGSPLGALFAVAIVGAADGSDWYPPLTTRLSDPRVAGALRGGIVFRPRWFKVPAYAVETNPIVPVDDEPALERLYACMRDAVVSGAWPVCERVAVGLAALHLQATLGDRCARSVGAYFAGRAPDALLPRSVAAPHLSNEYWRARLARAHGPLAGVAPLAAKARAVALARERGTFFGTSFFKAVAEGVAVTLAVAEDGVYVLSGSDLAVTNVVPFEKLAGWDEAPTGAQLVVRNAPQPLVLDMLPDAAAQFIGLVSGYYWLLHSSVRARVPVVESLVRRDPGLPPADLFARPVPRRTLPSLVPGASDAVKVRLNALMGEVNVRGFHRRVPTPLIEVLDRCMDSNGVVTTIPLGDCNLSPDELAAVMDVVTSALQHEPADRGIYRHDVRLTGVDISGNAAGSEVVEDALIPLLATARTVSEINLSGMSIGDRLPSILSSIARSRAAPLRRITLNGCGLTPTSMAALVSYARTRPLLLLSVTDNPLLTSRAVGALFADASSAADVVDLSATGIDIELLRSLRAAAADEVASVRSDAAALSCPGELSLDDCPALEDGAGGAHVGAELGALLAASAGVRKLSVRRASITSKAGAVALFDGAARCEQLAELIVSGNDFGRAAPRSVFAFLAPDAYCRVSVLDIAQCGLTTTLSVALADALRGNASVATLVMDGNAVGESDGALPPSWVEVLTLHPALRVVSMANVGLGARGVFAALAASGSRAGDAPLQRLALDGNNAYAIADVYAHVDAEAGARGGHDMDDAVPEGAAAAEFISLRECALDSRDVAETIRRLVAVRVADFAGNALSDTAAVGVALSHAIVAAGALEVRLGDVAPACV